MSWYSGGRGERLRKVMNHDFKTRGREEKCLARRHSLPFSRIKSAGKKEKSCEKLAEKLLCTFLFRYISDLASTKITLIPHVTWQGKGKKYFLFLVILFFYRWGKWSTSVRRQMRFLWEIAVGLWSTFYLIDARRRRETTAGGGEG